MGVGLKISGGVETKHKLSSTLKNWLPILHSNILELNEAIKPFVEENPLIEVKNPNEEDFSSSIPKKILNGYVHNASSEKIEALTIQKESLYDVLYKQIDSHLFPTPLSRKIAEFVVKNLDENGYYEGDTTKFCDENGIESNEFEKIRSRFRYIEPVGIGAKDLKESFLFQLDNAEISDGAYTLALKLINDMENIHSYSKEAYFDEAIKVVKGFKNPPNLEYLEDEEQIVPDIYIYFDEERNIQIKLNDDYYPVIEIDRSYDEDMEFVKHKLKEAKNLVDAIEMRKATLYKVGLMIIEYQYDFFIGGDIKPLTLKTLADEFGHNPSTISRAIANKYIACNRGLIPMKNFFTTAIEEDISNAAIKDFVKELVKNEPKDKPLSDMKILSMVQEKFKVDIGRRTIAKYRLQLNIPGSSERKKLYRLGV